MNLTFFCPARSQHLPAFNCAKLANMSWHFRTPCVSVDKRRRGVKWRHDFHNSQWTPNKWTKEKLYYINLIILSTRESIKMTTITTRHTNITPQVTVETRKHPVAFVFLLILITFPFGALARYHQNEPPVMCLHLNILKFGFEAKSDTHTHARSRTTLLCIYLVFVFFGNSNSVSKTIHWISCRIYV